MPPNAVRLFADYASAPDADAFMPASIDQLRAIRAELVDAEPTGLGIDQDMRADLDLLDSRVIPAAEQGEVILVARDEDGWYFAVPTSPR